MGLQPFRPSLHSPAVVLCPTNAFYSMFGDGPQRGHFGLRPPAAADLLASKVRWHQISRTLWPLGLIWRSLLSRSRKGQRRFGGFDQKIIAMCAQRMTVWEIQGFLEEQYKVEVSADLGKHSYRLGLRGCNRMAKPAAGVDVSSGRFYAGAPGRNLRHPIRRFRGFARSPGF